MRLASRAVRRARNARRFCACPRVEANYAPLSPITFLERAEVTFPDHEAVVHGSTRRSYRELGERCRRLSSALGKFGVQRGDAVSVMLSNTPEMVESHYGIPMSGGVLNAINTRLDADTVAYILSHAESKVLITDCEYSPVVKRALSLLKERGVAAPIVIDMPDAESPDSISGELLARDGETYEALIESGDPSTPYSWPADEWDSISLNYTSGTTGKPKGVLYHHRGAFLNATGESLVWSLPQHFRYLWTLPMFHCNGWCFPWTVSAMGGTHICLRKPTTDGIFDAFAREQATHLCGAPIIMSMIIDGSDAQKASFDHDIKMMTAAAPPPAVVLEKMAGIGIEMLHVYGLTEVYGPSVVCAKQESWTSMSPEKQAELNSRQGVRYPVLEGLMVADPETLEPVPNDGKTIGEIFMKGNIVMKGYHKNKTETDKAFANGWFHTGDLAVSYPDRYLKIMDRSKDIIISGGENISSVEVENAIYKHPSVRHVAVVAKPDVKWGEVPCAFVELLDEAEALGQDAVREELAAHCRKNLAGFMCPKAFVFGELPKTNIGKIKKFQLRERAAALDNDRR